jgi:hypothetical protein
MTDVERCGEGEIMQVNDLPYPQRLVAEMIYFALFQSEKTKGMTGKDVLIALGSFFTDEQIEDAGKLLSRP